MALRGGPAAGFFRAKRLEKGWHQRGAWAETFLPLLDALPGIPPEEVAILHGIVAAYVHATAPMPQLQALRLLGERFAMWSQRLQVETSVVDRRMVQQRLAQAAGALRLVETITKTSSKVLPKLSVGAPASHDD